MSRIKKMMCWIYLINFLNVTLYIDVLSFQVTENVGGRLLVRYDGSDDDLEPFWIFFTNPRLSSFGYVTNKVKFLKKKHYILVQTILIVVY
jgi:hypothetical protein